MQRDRRNQPIDDRVRIEHMLVAARDLRAYIEGWAREDICTDSMLLRALTKAV